MKVKNVFYEVHFVGCNTNWLNLRTHFVHFEKIAKIISFFYRNNNDINNSVENQSICWGSKLLQSFTTYPIFICRRFFKKFNTTRISRIQTPLWLPKNFLFHHGGLVFGNFFHKKIVFFLICFRNFRKNWFVFFYCRT